MQIPFSSKLQKILLIGAVAALAIFYTGVGAKRLAASLYGDRVELSSLQKAVRLDPSDADYHHHLGRFYALVQRDPTSAITEYLAAVQLNPHSARYWFDLSSAYQVLGDREHQGEALERAVQADPATPDVAWEAANLHLVEGQTDKALHEFGVVMANDNALTSNAIRFCWRILPDVDALLSTVVPARTEAYLAFMDLLQSKGEIAGTEKVWAALVRSGQPFELRNAMEYIKFLLLTKEVAPAELAWQQTAAKFGLASYLPSANNLIVNGDFTLDILNGGLDWHYHKQQGVRLTLDPREFHGGRRSLQITFDGPGISDAGVYQIVPVQPDTAYSFSAYYKSADFEGAGGPHFVVRDFYGKDIFYESDELKDGAFWKSATGEFTTKPDSKAVLLEVLRLPEGSPIRGKLWINDFRLTRK